MVGGFLTAQVFAICAWTLFYSGSAGSAHTAAKLSHVLLQTAGLTCMVLGLVAIVEHRQYVVNGPTFSTMHSVVGVMAVGLFGANYIFGAVMALLTAFDPQSVLRKHIDLRRHHRKLGGAALVVTLVAAVSGIMDQMPQGTCFYRPTSTAGFSSDSTEQYADMTSSCQVSLGLGIVATLAVLFTLSVALDREVTAPAVSAQNKDVGDEVEYANQVGNSSNNKSAEHVYASAPVRVMPDEETAP